MGFFDRSHAWNTVLFTAFVLALLFVYTGMWQLAFFAGLFAGILGKKGRRDFGLGFLGVGLAWAGHLLWFYLFFPAGELASLFAEILGLSAGMGFLLPVLAVLIGGIAGGLGGLTGAYLGQLGYPTKPASAGAESGS